jgi:hypothetical protein
MRTSQDDRRDLANVMVLHLPTLRSNEFLSHHYRQFVQIRLNFQTVLESIDRKKELHVIGVEEYTYVIENLRYSVDKPDEAKFCSDFMSVFFILTLWWKKNDTTSADVMSFFYVGDFFPTKHQRI